MNSKERLTKLFNGQKIDRVPIWLLFPFHRFGAYVDVYKIPSYKKVLAEKAKYADIFDRRSFNGGFCLSVSPEIKLEHEQEKKGDRIVSKNKIIYKDIELNEELVSISDNLTTRSNHFVEKIEDFDKILSLPYQPPRPKLDSFFKEKEELGNKGLMMASTGDPLGILHGLCSQEQFSIWTLTERDKLINFLDQMYQRYLDYYQYLLDNGIGPVYFIVGAEFAGPPMVAPGYFNELSVRYVKGIVDLIRSYGMKSIVHHHGNIKQILKGMKEINPDGLHTIEAPPVGDCTLLEARKVLGDIILIGNIQYDDLRRKSPAEIDNMVEQMMTEGKSGRFILSPTAGPYEEQLSEKMQENYIQFMKAGVKYGKLN